jgi:signal transduction histidine kinase
MRAATNASQNFGIMFGLDGLLAGTRGAAVLRRVARVFADPVWFTRRAVAVLRARQPLTGEQLSCRDGRTVEWDYWPMLVNGRHRGGIWLAWDMSDRKELEQQRLEAQRQLTEQNERLRQLDEARNQFLAIISHELRALRQGAPALPVAVVSARPGRRAGRTAGSRGPLPREAAAGGSAHRDGDRADRPGTAFIR